MNSSKTSAAPRRHTNDKKQATTCSSKHADHPYEPYVNHAACIAHQMWWRSPKLFGAAVVSVLVATVGLTSTILLLPELTADSTKLVFAPLPTSSASPRQPQAEFQSLCKSGQALVNAGKMTEGLNQFKKAEALKDIDGKSKAELFNDMAIALHQTGQQRDSVRYLERAIQADPTLISARNNLALVLIDIGDNDRASAVLHEAARLQPKNLSVLNRLLRLTGDSKISMSSID